MLLRRFPGVRIGFDYLNVLGGVAKLIDKGALEPPLPFIKDGDLLATIHTMIQQREGTVEVSEVKGPADQAMVDDATVRHEHFVGSDGADTARIWEGRGNRTKACSHSGQTPLAHHHVGWTFTSSWLLSLELGLTMVVMVVLLRTP